MPSLARWASASWAASRSRASGPDGTAIRIAFRKQNMAGPNPNHANPPEPLTASRSPAEETEKSSAEERAALRRKSHGKCLADAKVRTGSGLNANHEIFGIGRRICREYDRPSAT